MNLSDIHPCLLVEANHPEGMPHNDPYVQLLVDNPSLYQLHHNGAQLKGLLQAKLVHHWHRTESKTQMNKNQVVLCWQKEILFCSRH
jgi:hypothetical protein